MTGRMRGRLAALALTLGLAAPAGAGPIIFHRHDDEPDCPRPAYSCLHYFAPSLYRCRAFHTDHPEYLYARVPCPELVAYETFAAPCPAVDPAVLARYSLRYAYIGSTYVSQPAAAQDKDKAADAPKKDGNGTTPKRDGGTAPRPERLPPPKADK